MRPCGDRPESLFRPSSGRYQDVERTLNGRHPDAIVCVAVAEWVAKTIASKDAPLLLRAWDANANAVLDGSCAGAGQPDL